MAPNRKRRWLATNGVSKGVSRAIDTKDNSENLIAVQSAWLSRRLGLAPVVAQLVAELAFITKEAMR